MGGKGSGNRRARGKRGNKGGTGRPPKPERERLQHSLYLAVNERMYAAILAATQHAGYKNYQEFLRAHLARTVEDTL